MDDDEDDHEPWLNQSRSLLAAAKGDESRVAKAVFDLSLTAFHDLHFSPMIVWDYLTISTPGLFGEAGYTDGDVETLMPVIEKAIRDASNEPAAG